MKKRLGSVAAGIVLLAVSMASAQQPAGNPGATAKGTVQAKLEAYLRKAFALGADYKITVGGPKEVGQSGLEEFNVEVNSPQGSDKVKMYVTQDGKYLLRGEISDLNKDPLAENTAKISIADAPMLGDPKAPVTVVEYGDFQCPVCRNLHDALRGLLPNYPQVRLVFKDFPLDAVHPWARTAALAGRCTYQQDPKAFWKYYDAVYDQQEVISPGNVYDKVLEFAGGASLDKDAMKACLAGPKAAAEVDASIANGNMLEVRSTPTIFVNGRRVVGADPHTIQQYIDYELAELKAKK